MTRHFKFSKRLHLATILCFFFPFFFFTGCGQSPEEQEALAKAKADSLALVQQYGIDSQIFNDSVHSSTSDTISQTETAALETTDIPQVEKEDKLNSPSKKIAEECPFLQPLLIPKPDTYTGIAMVLDTFPMIIFSAVSFSFILLIISLAAKFLDKNARKTIILIEILSLFSLFNSTPFSWEFETLWGFVVCLVFISLLTLHDLYLIRLIYLESKTQQKETIKIVKTKQ